MPAIARVLIGAMLNAMIVADGRGENQRVLFMIDEAARLGRMKVLEMIRDAGRKYRVAMHMLWQSVGQMEDIWGPGGRKSWYDNATWRAYSSVRDPQAAKDISDACGSFGAMAFSEGDNTGRQGGAWNASLSRGRNLNRHEIRRELLKPQEVVSDLPADEVIILGLQQPLRLKRALVVGTPGARRADRGQPVSPEAEGRSRMTEERDPSRNEQRAQVTLYIDRMAELGRTQLQADRFEKQGLKQPERQQNRPARITPGK